MLIPPKYQFNQKLGKLLNSVESNREYISSATLNPKIEFNIKRNSTLRSALFSAKIEGNTLSLDELSEKRSKDAKKLEVFNLMKATNYVDGLGQKPITEAEISEIHMIVIGMERVDGKKIIYRNNMEAIFNSSGIAIYLPPPPRMIGPLMQRLINYSNSDREGFIPIKAAIVHYVFEKIHPFLDGNGRVGRLLIRRVMNIGGYGMKGLVPLEEYLDEKRASYYRRLEDPFRDVTDYVEFMLTAIFESSSKIKKDLLNRNFSEEDSMLPRRAELLRIIKDHKMMSFDSIRRRFLKVNERTLRYDLKKLQDGGFIKKLGITRGVVYTVVALNYDQRL